MGGDWKWRFNLMGDRSIVVRGSCGRKMAGVAASTEALDLKWMRQGY